MAAWWGRFLRRWHPEGIPWPGSVVYNAISQTEIFQRHYAMVAAHVASYCRAGRILDIGTGPGWLLLALRQSMPVQVVGVDISKAMLAAARRNVERAARGAPIELQVASAEALPFPRDVFDAVVSTGSPHHWRDPIAALNEAHRVLKPGGHALVYDLVRNMPPSVAEEARREFGAVRTRLLWLHSFEEPFYSPRDMEALVPATRFQRGESRFIGMFCCLVLRKTGDG